MTEAVKGRPVDEVEALLFRDFHALLTDVAPEGRDFGKLEVLAGVREFPRAGEVRHARLAHAAQRAGRCPRHRADGMKKKARKGPKMNKPMGEILEVRLTRDCPAVLVPWGSAVTLEAGEYAQVTQRLGGTFTVMVNGSLYRIAGSEADALGLEAESAEAIVTQAEDGSFSREAVEAAACGTSSPLATTPRSRSTSSIPAWSMAAN